MHFGTDASADPWKAAIASVRSQPAAAPFPGSSTAAVSTLPWIQKHLMYRPTQPRGLSRRHQNDRVLQTHDIPHSWSQA